MEDKVTDALKAQMKPIELAFPKPTPTPKKTMKRKRVKRKSVDKRTKKNYT